MICNDLYTVQGILYHKIPSNISTSTGILNIHFIYKYFPGLNRAVVSILQHNLYEPKIDVASHCASHNSWTLAPNAGNPNGYLLEPDFEIK